MSSDIINEEERVADEQQAEAVEIVRGTIRELCGLNERVVALYRSATVADAVNAMIQNRMGALLIVEDGKLYGMFSERDVLTRVVAQGRVPAETPITDVMTPDPECLSFDDEIVFALNKMIVGGFRHFPILDRSYQTTRRCVETVGNKVGDLQQIHRSSEYIGRCRPTQLGRSVDPSEKRWLIWNPRIRMSSGLWHDAGSIFGPSGKRCV